MIVTDMELTDTAAAVVFLPAMDEGFSQGAYRLGDLSV